MKIILISLAFILSGCSTVVPVTQKFPEPPGILVQEPCPELKKLSSNPKLSEVAKTVVSNYSEYYMCAAKLDSWQRWYQEQKLIYESIK